MSGWGTADTVFLVVFLLGLDLCLFWPDPPKRRRPVRYRQ